MHSKQEPQQWDISSVPASMLAAAMVQVNALHASYYVGHVAATLGGLSVFVKQPCLLGLSARLAIEPACTAYTSQLACGARARVAQAVHAKFKQQMPTMQPATLGAAAGQWKVVPAINSTCYCGNPHCRYCSGCARRVCPVPTRRPAALPPKAL
jgi:hypothetical protein